jgi:CubicO group peptidase (beta-lactamase class C family)
MNLATRRSLACFVLSAAAVVVAASDKPQLADPESAGFSAQRLQRLTQGMRAKVDGGELSGIVSLIARHGKVVYADVYGKQDIAAGTPMKEDTIFRIYSMTKPVTGVAMMMLYEEGKWLPRDPIAMHIPEFANLKVYAGTDAAGKPILEAPAHPPTVGELMSHTAGFVYGLWGEAPVDKMYAAKQPLAAGSLHEMIKILGDLPLAYQPGTQWVYSISVDIQGYLVEKLSGKPLHQFMRERLFDRLGMKDTDFLVPQAKLPRLATIYSMDAGATKLAPMPRDANVSKTPGLVSGGGGLYSTAHDYLRFAQMLLNGGELDGVRYLSPVTVELMRSNHLSPQLTAGGFGIGFQQMRPGFGFGYDVAVFDDPAMAGTTTGKGSYLWDGAAGTWFWIDPTHDLVFIGMIQRWASPRSPNWQDLARALTYQALVDPKR